MSNNVKLLLKESIKNVGRVGDVVEVSSGYARNYLLPNDLAVQPTPNNIKKGGALTTDGTYIYAFRGDKQKTFWRCNATTTGTAGSCGGYCGCSRRGKRSP